MACSLISEVIHRIANPSFQAHVKRIGNRLLTESVGNIIRCTSGRGLLVGLHTSKPASDVQAALLEHGVIVGDSKDPNVIRLLPPLILSDDQVDLFVRALKEIGN